MGSFLEPAVWEEEDDAATSSQCDPVVEPGARIAGEGGSYFAFQGLVPVNTLGSGFQRNVYSVLQSAHSIQDTNFLTNNKQSSYIGLPANSGPDFQSSNSKQDADKAGANSSPSLRNRQKEVKAAPLSNRLSYTTHPEELLSQQLISTLPVDERVSEDNFSSFLRKQMEQLTRP